MKKSFKEKLELIINKIMSIQGIEDQETAINKRRLRFNGHIFRMEPLIINKQIFYKLFNLWSQGGYNKQMQEQLRRLEIIDKDCQD